VSCVVSAVAPDIKGCEERRLEKEKGQKIFHMNIKMLHHIVTIAYSINIFGEDSK
jgi:hypothetical protein